ncbi:hypothetical protein [Micromonospora craniellae]|uniref:hypothetical protein n=1 Tax=Micromonospora craniellae TaxID=2294034 RepID=UPI00168BE0CC|nr:hypothetical protein [Micromonospora craniellae]QOC94253.1 hypothetical protein ID554_12020 [Micromonospora craniellae]
MTMNEALPRRITTAFSIGAALAIATAVLGTPASAASTATDARATDALQAACWYAAHAPNKDGGIVRGWGEKWDCGDQTFWTITVQRHRGGAWWQNEATNNHTGNNWVSAGAGCVPGTWTYRTILESNSGHQMVSTHRTITC